jgi:hypothetical protein
MKPIHYTKIIKNILKTFRWTYEKYKVQQKEIGFVIIVKTS